MLVIYFKDQDSIQDYKKVIKILDLCIDLFLGPTKIVFKITRK